MKSIHVDLGKNSYDIYIQQGLLTAIGTELPKLVHTDKIAIISDTNVDALYGAQLEAVLTKAGISSRRIVFTAGEQQKNIATLAKVYAELSAFGITRKDAIITFGGGVPGDLGGFAAATFLRGIPFIQIPTTILAQVDSSVGGKVAIDLPSGKNLAGSFYQPKAVFIDPLLVKTLPLRMIHDGLAEVIKYGCIRDAALFELFEHIHGDDDIAQHWEHIIQTCCSIKARIVEHDEFDNGERMLLNFGHTLGHAIEKYYGYGTYTHGEAVAVGMSLLTERTEALGLTKKGTTVRIRQVLEKFSLPVSVDAPAVELLKYIGQDKKKRGNDITLVVLDAIGTGRLLPVAGSQIPVYVRKGSSK
jgi:3-dehydroquinate synthase